MSPFCLEKENPSLKKGSLAGENWVPAVKKVYDPRVPGDFAERLEDARKARGWSAADLANLSGVSDGQVSKYESRKSQPDSGTLKRFVETLELSSDYFLGLDGRFSRSPGFRSAAHLTLDRYARATVMSPNEEVVLRHIADNHEHPPVSAEEWGDLKRSLQLTQLLPGPQGSGPKRTRGGLQQRRYAGRRPA